MLDTLEELFKFIMLRPSEYKNPEKDSVVLTPSVSLLGKIIPALAGKVSAIELPAVSETYFRDPRAVEKIDELPLAKKNSQGAGII